mmetsp:Transcript_17972/g.36271  ORF Transcript_17972/g.36271 Transcript_17972/m.36271 type:complete len:227 (+) Transcript_17972:77-757(+)
MPPLTFEERIRIFGKKPKKTERRPCLSTGNRSGRRPSKTVTFLDEVLLAEQLAKKKIERLKKIKLNRTGRLTKKFEDLASSPEENKAWDRAPSAKTRIRFEFPESSTDSSEQEEEDMPQPGGVLIDRSRYLDNDQYLMYTFTRKPVGLVFYPRSLRVQEARRDANAAGVTKGDILLEIDGRPVTAETFPEVYQRTMVPLSMKFRRPKPGGCDGCTCSRNAPGCIIS